MAVGASIITRKVLGEALLKRQSGAGLKDKDVRAIAAQCLHNNAVEIYNKGEIYI